MTDPNAIIARAIAGYAKQNSAVPITKEEWEAGVAQAVTAALAAEGWAIVKAELPEIRPNEDGTIDEVVGYGFFHIEQMDNNKYWAKLSTQIKGKDVVMWLTSRGKLKLSAEFE